MTWAQTQLGITMKTFGAPYNQTDNTFLTVLEENTDVRTWLFCDDVAYSKACLVRGTSNLLESSTGVVSYNSFLTAYNANSKPYLVLQGHPGNPWSNTSFVEFDKVIKFLKSQGDCFVLPDEYYQIVNGIGTVVSYSENFKDTSKVYMSGGISKVIAKQSCCGELKMEMNLDSTLGANEPLIHQIHKNGIADTIDVSNSKKIVVRARSKVAMNIRVDFSDGINATNGANGQLVQSIPADTLNWTLLTFDFPVSSFTDTGVDTTVITEIHIYPNSGTGNFPGKLYIDYISIGDAISSTAKCRTDVDPNPCLSIFEDQFNDGVHSLSGSTLVKLNVSETVCGELKLEMRMDSILLAFKPITYNFPTPINMTVNSKIIAKVRCATSFPLRFDLHDGTVATNGVNGRVSNTIPADINNWTILEYNYSPQAFADNGVNASAITRINIQLDPSNDNFPGPLYIDFIAVGQPTGVGNATGKSDIDSCLPTSLTDEHNHIMEDYDFHLSPNPVDDAVQLVYNGQAKVQIRITDLVGKTHIIQNSIYSGSKIDVAKLKSGIYFLHASNDEGFEITTELIVR